MHIEGKWEDTLERCLKDSTRLVTGATPYCLIFDSRGASMPGVFEVKRLSRWILDYQRELRKNVIGVALIINRAAIRGALRAIFRIQTLPVQWSCFEDFDAAALWARQITEENDQIHSAAA